MKRIRKIFKWRPCKRVIWVPTPGAHSRAHMEGQNSKKKTNKKTKKKKWLNECMNECLSRMRLALIVTARHRCTILRNILIAIYSRNNSLQGDLLDDPFRWLQKNDITIMLYNNILAVHIAWERGTCLPERPKTSNIIGNSYYIKKHYPVT